MEMYLSSEWMTRCILEASQGFGDYSDERSLSIGAPKPDRIEVAFEELKDSEMRSNQFLGSLLLSHESSLVCWRVLLLDIERVWKPEVLAEYSHFPVDGSFPCESNFRKNSRFHPRIFVYHPQPKGYAELYRCFGKDFEWNKD